jgi:hypothetical protein
MTADLTDPSRIGRPRLIQIPFPSKFDHRRFP